MDIYALADRIRAALPMSAPDAHGSRVGAASSVRAGVAYICAPRSSDPFCALAYHHDPGEPSGQAGLLTVWHPITLTARLCLCDGEALDEAVRLYHAR